MAESRVRVRCTLTVSDVTGWLGGNALDFGFDDHGFESRCLLSIFFLSFSAGSIAIAY